MCTRAGYRTSELLSHLGIHSLLIFSKNLENSIGHSFVMSILKVKDKEGKVNTRTYLFDTTFSQFFKLQKNTPSIVLSHLEDKEEAKYDPGYYMMQSEVGKEITEELLSRGHTELTEEKANIYFNSLVRAGNKFILNKNTKLTGREIIRGFFKYGENIKAQKDNLEGYLYNSPIEESKLRGK
jgi:hypothetical protein